MYLGYVCLICNAGLDRFYLVLVVIKGNIHTKWGWQNSVLSAWQWFDCIGIQLLQSGKEYYLPSYISIFQFFLKLTVKGKRINICTYVQKLFKLVILAILAHNCMILISNSINCMFYKQPLVEQSYHIIHYARYCVGINIILEIYLLSPLS